jgi:hypothetical protein
MTMNRDLGVWTSEECALVLIDYVEGQKAAPSSSRTCSQSISPSRRSASVNQLTESPGRPSMRRTPEALRVAIIASATVSGQAWCLLSNDSGFIYTSAVRR